MAHPAVIVKHPMGTKVMFDQLNRNNDKRDVSVVLIYGPTGTGKTNYAMSQKDVFKKDGMDQWFDGYNGESTLLIDDFAGSCSRITLSFLLTLLDRYPVNLPVKRSFEMCKAKWIIVTSNIHPRMWYDYSKREEHYRALARRFHEVWWFTPEHKCKLVPKNFFENWYEYCNEKVVFIEDSQGTQPLTPYSSGDMDMPSLIWEY